MARPRTAMRNIREVLRPSHEAGLSPRQVETSLGLSRITVRRYLDRAQDAGLGWPLPADMDDAALERALFPSTPPPSTSRPDPDFAWMHRELRRKGGDVAAVVGGVQAGPSRWLSVQPVLPALSAVGRVGGSGVAPAASGWRQAVCRLRRADDPDLPTREAGLAGRAVRRRVGGHQPRRWPRSSCRTGSGPTWRPSSSSMPFRRWWFRTICGRG